MLEAAKTRLEMSIEQMRKENKKEVQQRDEEVEEVRIAAQKKVKGKHEESSYGVYRNELLELLEFVTQYVILFLNYRNFLILHIFKKNSLSFVTHSCEESGKSLVQFVNNHVFY